MLDPKEEARYADLRDKARELKVPLPPDIFIKLQVHDKNGILIFNDKQRGHSWVRNFYNAFANYFGVPATDTSTLGAGHINWYSIYWGSLYANQSGMVWPTAVGGIGAANAGIVVGTSDAAFSLNHTALQALIGNGNSSGLLAYQAQNAFTGVYDAGVKKWSALTSRIFNNNSGGSITIKEVGIYGYMSNHYGLAERSVLSPTVPVPNGAQLTVSYQFDIDFSAID